MEVTELEQFIIKAKANGYVGGLTNGRKISPTKVDSNDLVYDQEDYHYHDSYVGNSNFCGQELVTRANKAVWSMVYYGYVLRPDKITGDEAGQFLQESLSKMYLQENRFLGGFTYTRGDLEYRDMNFGDFKHFHGIEKIFHAGELVYELQYCGGIMMP